jgi:plasmid stabilization system protein ParE
MYNIEYLPSALNDIKEITRYVGVKLDNPSAADRLAEDIVDAVESLSDTPYKYPVYIPLVPLENEYRKILVHNYFVFYCVSENDKTVTVYRVMFAKRDIDSLL